MKTVFIATDFSVAAENATKYGIAMASDLGLKIVLFNASNNDEKSKQIYHDWLNIKANYNEPLY